MTNEKKYTGIDRRRYPRVNAAVNYSVAEEALAGQMQGTRNISAGGIAFFAREKIETGVVLSLEMDLPDMSLVKARARVVWQQPIKIPEDGSVCCELGVEFTDIDEPARKKISRYVFLRLDTD